MQTITLHTVLTGQHACNTYEEDRKPGLFVPVISPGYAWCTGSAWLSHFVFFMFQILRQNLTGCITVVTQFCLRSVGCDWAGGQSMRRGGSDQEEKPQCQEEPVRHEVSG